MFVDEEIWTFARDERQLEIRRTQNEEGFLLGIVGDGAPRTYFFAELARLRLFQSDLEKFLLGTGWAFIGFYPDRRDGRERRHYSRLIYDRRRWWTDGLKAQSPRELDAPDRRRRRQR